MQLQINDISQIDQAAREFVEHMDQATVFAFRGKMGAGKTTFIRAICRALGVGDDQTSSPTFALINEYRSDTTAELVYHFDLYRVESLDEALDMGVEDYLDCGALCLIEWPEVVDQLLPDDTVVVDITENPDGSRTVATSPIQ